MSRPKINESDKKIQLSITISREVSRKLDKLTNNKSKFIEDLILKIKHI